MNGETLRNSSTKCLEMPRRGGGSSEQQKHKLTHHWRAYLTKEYHGLCT
jgi:hypothetical protein